MKDGTLFFQFEKFTHTQAFHVNLTQDNAAVEIMTLIESNAFKQMDGFMTDSQWHALFNKKKVRQVLRKKKQYTD